MTRRAPTYLRQPGDGEGLMPRQASIILHMGVVKAPLCNSGLSVSHLTEGYCWRIYFKVLGVLFLGEVSPAFLPSKKACGTHKFRHLGVDQQYLLISVAARREARG